MKVALVVDYYPSIDSGVQYGGAEISISFLAKKLTEKGVRVQIVAPSMDFWDKRGRLFPEWFVGSPLWFLFSAVSIYRQLKRNSVDIIHVQGKNVFLGSVLANLFHHKPLVVTARDYRLLCNLGMCLLHGDNTCTFREYFREDIPKFVRSYTPGTKINYVYAYIVGIYQMILRWVFKSALSRVNKIICISRAQEKIFNKTGFANTNVIYNIGELDLYKGRKLKQVVYNGRYTLGKGKEILETIVPGFLRKHRDWRFIIIGRGESKIINKNLLMLGQTTWSQQRQIVARSSFVVMPSVWPEPFGRTALDAITVGTPVLASNRGGLPEIVTDGRFGIISHATAQGIGDGMEKMVKIYKNLSTQIMGATSELKVKFGSLPIRQHVAIYKSLLAKN